MQSKWKLTKVCRKPAPCGLDLGDGSERAEYVNQDYILQTLGRPHRNVNIMYTYYPKDKEWPQRISEACKDMEIHFQWDYPYDDYFPYEGGIGGNPDGEPFQQMRDIRRHGQDVTLTLTIDCSLEDEYLRQIARDLKPYGQMRLRINHECSGDWFTHNQRYSFEEIAAFFERFDKIVKEEAPNIRTVFCAGCVLDLENPDSPVQEEEAFKRAYLAADVWSVDCYLALHYGWPFDVCEKDSNSFATTPIDVFCKRLELTAKRLTKINGGVKKPLVVSEFNTDGDVTGPMNQGDSILRFVEKLKNDKAEEWFGGFTLYQFRDRGRLGLEIEDPNNKAVGIPQPLLYDYRQILKDPYFQPEVKMLEEIELPVTLRWGSAEDAEGISFVVPFADTPEFCELTFDEDVNLMIEINGRWFYKAPETKTVDLMPAFFDNPLQGSKELAITMFAPPATGQNDPEQGEDWTRNYYCTIHKLPELRLRYEPIAEI
ncbi:MAG: hypothetical protein J1E62_10890 [Lachnospiraceae bacterium]|nr:hypothetical protein [Lachnospiraceae bacterium]